MVYFFNNRFKEDIIAFEDILNKPENLENREVEYIGAYKDSEKPMTAIVIGYDFDVGVTIIGKDTKTHYLLCMHGKLSPMHRTNDYMPHNPTEYKQVFDYITTCIKNGRIVLKEVEEFLTTVGDFTNNEDRFIPSQDTCAFGQ